MQTYIGTKMVRAEKVTLGNYNQLRKWDMPEGEDPNALGYLVEYLDGGKPNVPPVPGFSNYISWSPKDVFEGSYRPVKQLTFGQAVEALKAGKKVARSGWNGKGMHIYYVPEGRYPPSTKAGVEIARRWKDGLVPYRPYIAMLTVTGEVVPWLASQSDVLEEDWQVVE